MPTRVLLEGPAIEPLLAQVRQEYGASVRIISADKVRTGGFGGFFAKQRYELSVEVPDEAPADPPTPAAPAEAEQPAQTLEQLLERAESRDRFAASPAQARTEQPADADPTAPTLPPRAGLVSTNGNAFAEVMAGFNAVGVQPALAPAQAVPAAASSAVRPFRPPTVTTPAVNGNSATAAALTDLTDFTVVSYPAAPQVDDHPPATAAVAFETAAAPLAPSVPAVGNSLTPSVPATVPVPVSPSVPAVSPADPLVANLVDLGMPEALATRVTGTDAYGAVLQALAGLPEAPTAPNRPGDVLVIAGELAHALPVARRVIEHLRLDAAKLLLAGPSAAGTGIHPARKLSGPAEAERKARKIHRADTAYVVVLDAPVTGMNDQWARDTCDAIGATAVWAVVDATRKTADTRSHLAALGDVEAVAVYGAAQTADPASVLGLDLPIVAVDGQPATRHTWAAVLCERLTRAEAAAAGANRRRRRGR